MQNYKKVKRHDLEDVVYGMELTFDEFMDVLELKYSNATSIGYTLTPGIFEIIDINLMLKSLLPDELKVSITIDDVRLKSNLTTHKSIRSSKKSFIYTILGLTQSHSGPLGDIEGFLQLIPGSYKRNEPINITGIDKFHLKCDCINGSILNGVTQPML